MFEKEKKEALFEAPVKDFYASTYEGIDSKDIPDFLKNSTILNSAILDSEVLDKPLGDAYYQSYENMKTREPEEVQQQSVNRAKVANNSIYKDWLVGTLGENYKELDDDALEAVSEMLAGNELLADTPVGLHYFIAERVIDDPTTDPRIILELASKDYSKSLFAETLSDLGWYDVGFDMVANIIPAVYLHNIHQAEEALGERDLEQMGIAFQAIDDPLKRAIAAQEIFPQLLSKTNNSVVAGDIYSYFMGQKDFSDIEFDKFLSWAEVAGSFVGLGLKGKKGIDLFNRLKDFDASDEASRLAADILDGTTHPQVVGQTMDQTQTMVNPLAGTDVKKAMGVGREDMPAADVMREVELRDQRLKAEAQKFRIERDGALDLDQRDAIQRQLEQEWAINNDVEKVEFSLDGKTLNVQGINRGTGEIIEDTFTLYDKAFGSWNPKVAGGGISKFVASPLHQLRNMAQDAVRRGIFLKDYMTAGNRARLNGMIRASTDGLSRKQLRNVDAVLLRGDTYRNPENGARGKVYSITQLWDGIQVDGVGLVQLQTKKELGAYYSARKVNDHMFRIRNTVERNTYIDEGFDSSIRLQRSGDSSMDPTVHEISEFAAVKERGVSTNDLPDMVWDVSKGKAIPRSEAINIIDSGKGKAYTARESVRVKRTDKAGGGDETYDTIIASDQYIDELPEMVLNYQEGYITRVRSNVNYIIKSETKGLVNGVESSSAVTRTEWMLDKYSDSSTALERLIQKELELNPGAQVSFLDEQLTSVMVGKKKFSVKASRDLDNTARDEIDINANFSGLFTGARSSREIPFGLNGFEAERVSSLESMERAASNLSRLASINTYRMGAERKFLNTYGQFLEGRSPTMKSAWKSGTTPDIRESGDTMKRFLDNMAGMATKESRMFENTTQRWAMSLEKFDSKIADKMRNGLMRMSAEDPFMYARAATFHALLGFFNPSQLVVQASGAALAFSINPTRWVSSHRQILGMRVAFQRLEAGRRDLDKINLSAIKMAGFDSAEEYSDVMNKLFDTGVWSTLRANADYQAVSRGMPMDAGALRRAFGSMTDKGLVFYREGEGYNRLYAVSNALQDWKKINKGRKFDQAAADEVVALSGKYTLHMTASNKAMFQEGLLSIPTQFMQVTTKFAEALLGNEFTLAQKARMVVGQGVLFGSFGIPFVGDDVAKAGLSAYLEVTGEDRDFTEQELATAYGGIWGAITNPVFGGGGLATNRFSTPYGLEETAESVWTGQFDFIGAAGGLGGRVKDAVLYNYAMFGVPPEHLSWQRIASVADRYFDVVSTWNNATQGLVWERLGNARNPKTGELLFPVESREDIARMMGLSTLRQQQLWTQAKHNYSDIQLRKRTIDFISGELVTYVSMDPDAVMKEETAILFGMAANMMGSEVEALEVIQASLKRVFGSNSKEFKLWQERQRQIANSYDTEDLPVSFFDREEE